MNDNRLPFWRRARFWYSGMITAAVIYLFDLVMLGPTNVASLTMAAWMGVCFVAYLWVSEPRPSRLRSAWYWARYGTRSSHYPVSGFVLAVLIAVLLIEIVVAGTAMIAMRLHDGIWMCGGDCPTLSAPYL
jgi:hypothetical protein